MDEIRVISSEIDGASLRREQFYNRYTVRCDGKSDDQEINDAIQSAGKSFYLGIGDAWDRIFGVNNG